MDMIYIMVIIFLLVLYAYGRFYLALIEDDKLEELNEDISVDIDKQWLKDKQWEWNNRDRKD
jgi:hypothetical protein|tara:strand:- start:467 stop:652 length:186 start_codon:yes stop_codon:yes gene_type:complete